MGEIPDFRHPAMRLANTVKPFTGKKSLTGTGSRAESSGMPVINKENARFYSAMGLAKRRANRDRQKNLDHTIAELSRKLDEISPIPRDQLSGFAEQRLKRVRKQLSRLDELMLEEKDPQRLAWLAAAQLRISQQEFDLAGRPRSGMLKPNTKTLRPMQVTTGPIGLSSVSNTPTGSGLLTDNSAEFAK